MRLLALAVATGALAGLAGVVLLVLVGSAAGLVGHCFVAPIGAGVLCVILQRRLAGAAGTGIPAVRAGMPLDLRTGLGHFVATVACLGTGWSGGREGPMVHAGAVIGSTVTDLLARWDDPARLRPQLVAAGAAGGIAGAMNTPVAAALLVWALLPRGGAIAVGAGAAAGAAAHRVIWADAPLLAMDAPPVAFPVACTIGAAAAVAALAYVAAVRLAPLAADRLFHDLPMLRPVAGGLLASVVVLAVPQVSGTGTALLVDGPPADPALLVGLLAAAIVAPAITVATRGCGGAIGPALVLGAVVGALVASSVPGGEACRLVGMAAVLAAATRLPLMAVAAVTELTGATGSVFAMLTGVTVAVLVAGACTTATIFAPAVECRPSSAGPDLRRYSVGEPR